MGRRIQLLPFKSVWNLPFRGLGRCCFSLNLWLFFGTNFDPASCASLKQPHNTVRPNTSHATLMGGALHERCMTETTNQTLASPKSYLKIANGKSWLGWLSLPVTKSACNSVLEKFVLVLSEPLSNWPYTFERAVIFSGRCVQDWKVSSLRKQPRANKRRDRWYCESAVWQGDWPPSRMSHDRARCWRTD